MKLRDLKQLGKTGRFPYGKVSEDDEGELRVAIGIDLSQGIVRIEFGKPVAWLGLPVNQARALSQMLLEKADELAKRRT